MNSENRERIDQFLTSLHQGFDGSRTQVGEILEEVRADLEAHVDRFQSKGLPEDEAVKRAVAEMGNPFELAFQMRRELPPFGGKVQTRIREVVACGAILWTLIILWTLRPASYGFGGAVLGAIIALVHLPVILLLWPRIVWKKNWMFGLVPGVMTLVVAMIFQLAGTTGSTRVIMEPGTQEAPQFDGPVFASSGLESSTVGLTLLFAGLGVTFLCLLYSMQQRAQRRWVILFTLLAVGGVEAVFQTEEFVFRQDLRQIREYLDSSVHKNANYPTDEVFQSEGPTLRSKMVTFRREGENTMIFWSRPLSPGHSICHSSVNDRVWVQD